MKNYICLLLLCMAVGIPVGHAKKMRIQYNNGTSETRQVSDIAKITFEEDDETGPGTGEIDSSEQMVDMGLSVKWAAWNVGATKPEEYGGFYAYGEIEEKTDYVFENYKWRYDDFLDQLDEWEYYLKLGANFSGRNYDVAHVNWGDKWRMPSRQEWQELFDNSTKEWTSVNGVKGAKFTSKINDNSIFIPAAGNKYNGQHDHIGTNCLYWTPEEYDYFSPSGWDMECRNYRVDISPEYSNTDGYDYPYIGFPVRAVYGDLPPEILPEMKAIPTAEEAIDLGLPSGTKWAPYNLGANTESGTGLYLCYGELTEKYYSHTYNYKYFDPLTGKCEVLNNGDIQGTEYDAAHVLWGDGWVIPNEDQIRELIDKCTWTANGSYGYRVTGPNGKSIYLPCLDQMTYVGIQYSSPRELLLPSSTATPNDDPDYKHGMIYGIAAQNGDTFMTSTTPYVRTWCSKEAAKQIRPVRK